jgi:hypothetical protein
MTTERGIRALAGLLVLISTGLGIWLSRYWFLLTGFVGANLLQSAFTGFCPAEWLMKKAGMKSCEETTNERKV